MFVKPKQRGNETVLLSTKGNKALSPAHAHEAFSACYRGILYAEIRQQEKLTLLLLFVLLLAHVINGWGRTGAGVDNFQMRNHPRERG
jgi:hypothetical protein